MVNLFTHYTQEENRFTNGLLAVLKLSHVANHGLVRGFFRKISPHVHLHGLSFKVLQDIDSTADGELSNDDICIHFETKILSGTLRKEQIRAHLRRLGKKKQKFKKLILLTPDDSSTSYVKQFTEGFGRAEVIHLAWKDVYDFLNDRADKTPPILSEVIKQYLSTIHDTIFKQDIAGIIQKIYFGDKSGVYPESYLKEMEDGEWTGWNTPRKYKHLDGKGRKLILYDRTRRGLTAEVEIRAVKKTKSEPDYPWTNSFVPRSLRIYHPPIPLDHIRETTGFENFGVHRKDRSAYRNVTQEQYRELVSR